MYSDHSICVLHIRITLVVITSTMYTSLGLIYPHQGLHTASIHTYRIPTTRLKNKLQLYLFQCVNNCDNISIRNIEHTFKTGYKTDMHVALEALHILSQLYPQKFSPVSCLILLAPSDTQALAMPN